MSDLPDVELVLGLPAQFDQPVGEEFIDQNGHMNIGDYFKLGTWAPWLRLVELGMDDDYIPVRGMSMFTVEHNIRYVAELRLGERFSVHGALVDRTSKAVHAAGFVVDRERDRLACVLEVVYVHVSMSDRRAVAIPDDLAAAIDADIASYGGDWLASAADRLTLRR